MKPFLRVGPASNGIASLQIINARQHHRKNICRHPAASNDGTPPNNDNEMSAEELIQNLLTTDPEAVAQINRVTEAANRVAKLQLEQARLARALAEANGESQLEAELQERQNALDSSAKIAAAEVQAAQLLLKAAELQAQDAAVQRQEWASQMEDTKERVESIKAGAAAVVGGTLGGLPLTLLSASTPVSFVLSLGGIAASSLLFGVVYRYAIRQDLDNAQLRSGAVAAFGLVRGIAQASQILGLASITSNDVQLSVDSLGTAAAAMGESMLVFGFAAGAVNLGFRQGLLKPFGQIKDSSTGQ